MLFLVFEHFFLTDIFQRVDVRLLRQVVTKLFGLRIGDVLIEEFLGLLRQNAAGKAIDRLPVELFLKLDKAGFDQVPCASNWCSSDRRRAGVKNDECMGNLVKFCRANLSPDRLKGFLMAPWAGDFDGKNFLNANFAGIDQLAAALG